MEGYGALEGARIGRTADYLILMVYRLLNAVKPVRAGAFAESLQVPFFLAVTTFFFTVQTFLVLVFQVTLAPCLVFFASFAFLPFFSFAGGFFSDWAAAWAHRGLRRSAALWRTLPGGPPAGLS